MYRISVNQQAIKSNEITGKRAHVIDVMDVQDNKVIKRFSCNELQIIGSAKVVYDPDKKNAHRNGVRVWIEAENIYYPSECTPDVPIPE